ncbi:MAG: ribosome biogenesis GTPase Der [Pseudomonadota bacterium]
MTLSQKPCLVIIGRPNVGKSTLFNRLCSKNMALVAPTPGLTRDIKKGFGQLAGIEFEIYDTPGFEKGKSNTLESRMQDLSKNIVKKANLILFLFDVRSGVLGMDIELAKWLRQINTPILLLANKCEHKFGIFESSEAWKLGLGEPHPISASHGIGMDSIWQALDRLHPNPLQIDDQSLNDKVTQTSHESPPIDGPIRMAIIGRPNVGKSSLINAFVGENTVLSGPEAGLTHDSTQHHLTFKKQEFLLFDTAGLRRKNLVKDQIERMCVQNAFDTIRFAHVVILLLDADEILSKQDLILARKVEQEGRALILAINKIDHIHNRKKQAQLLNETKMRLEKQFAQIAFAPIIAISARYKINLDQLMHKSCDIFEKWNRRIKTSELNHWITQAIENHPPALVKGGNVQVRYITQIKRRPPSFIIFISIKDSLDTHYLRYLRNSLRKYFMLEEISLRLSCRTRKNPYHSGSN